MGHILLLGYFAGDDFFEIRIDNEQKSGGYLNSHAGTDERDIPGGENIAGCSQWQDVGEKGQSHQNRHDADQGIRGSAGSLYDFHSNMGRDAFEAFGVGGEIDQD